MRIMAVDYGDKRIGLAVSDPGGILAGDAWTMEEWDMRRAAERIAREAESRDVGKIVLGLPLNMDGTEGPRAGKSRELAALLQEVSGLEILLRDERRTTVDAHRILRESGKRMKKHRGTVDSVAAALILEGYLGELK